MYWIRGRIIFLQIKYIDSVDEAQQKVKGNTFFQDI